MIIGWGVSRSNPGPVLIGPSAPVMEAQPGDDQGEIEFIVSGFDEVDWGDAEFREDGEGTPGSLQVWTFRTDWTDAGSGNGTFSLIADELNWGSTIEVRARWVNGEGVLGTFTSDTVLVPGEAAALQDLVIDGDPVLFDGEPMTILIEA